MDDEISLKEVQNTINQLASNSTFRKELADYLKSRNSTIKAVSLDKVSAEKKNYEVQKTKAEKEIDDIIEKSEEKSKATKYSLPRSERSNLQLIKNFAKAIIKAVLVVANIFMAFKLSTVLGILY